MTDPVPGFPPNGSIARMLIGSLPPAFLLLLILNAVFMYFLLRTTEHQLESRNKLVNEVMERCLDKPRNYQTPPP